MNSTYKRLGNYIIEVDERNTDLSVNLSQGICNLKYFQDPRQVAENSKNDKIVRKGNFAYNRATTRNGEKISIAYREGEDCTVSSSYLTFKIIDEEQLNPYYLMMWFKRPEFDRYARFKSHGSAHEYFEWDEMCDVMLPVPPIEEQRRVVAEYQAIEQRIENNRQLIAKLEQTAQAIYRKMFVDDIDPENLPAGWHIGTIGEFCSKIGSGATPSGGKQSYKKTGISLIRSMNVYDLRFTDNDLAKIDDCQALKLSNVIVEPEDVLFNITGVSVARCCKVIKKVLPARVNQHVMILRTINKNNSEYLLLTLNHPDNKMKLLSISEGASTREAITKSDVEHFALLIPDKDTLKLFHDKVAPILNYHEVLLNENGVLHDILVALHTKLSKS
jgi:type I restriction enzyme S subunit